MPTALIAAAAKIMTVDLSTFDISAHFAALGGTGANGGVLG